MGRTITIRLNDEDTDILEFYSDLYANSLAGTMLMIFRNVMKADSSKTMKEIIQAHGEHKREVLSA